MSEARSRWTLEEFAEAIAKLRSEAKALRARAEKKDAEADDLRKECAAKSTEKLPLFE